MSRLRWIPFSPKSVVRRILTIDVQSSDGFSRENVSQFQLGLFHSSTSAHWGRNVRKQAECETSGLVWSKRYIHATGIHQSIDRDYYEILGVSVDATPDEIKKAFHALAKKYHPDANRNNPSAKRKFQEIRDAYETLQDPGKRAQYNRLRKGTGRTENAGFSDTAWDQFRDANFRDARGTQFSNSFHKIFYEIFENEAENLDGDIQVELLLEFSEAATGCTKHLSFNADVPCEACRGRGHPLDAGTRICPTCRGIGTVTIPPFTTTCSTCKGSGQIIKDYCTVCKGSGVCEGIKNVKVTIPAGVDSGDTIRVPKAGNSSGLGKSPGDLFINLKVATDRVFNREGADLYVDANISFTEAILGGSVEVPTLSGNTQMRIPKGVQHGQLVVLRNKGLPRQGFFVDHGDLYVRFCIRFPSTVSQRQRTILEEFEKEIIDDENRSAEGSRWQHWIEHLTGSKFIRDLSILLLIFLILGKALN
ncbi:chaperone protein dnaJ 1, mitochondrial isoform X2 [Andrographis paniculata]|uniref:chaperone protein dnaJ 1, mitochondrial isoform X2 n=1 Tax=Andrographis paniculata TaxID=175694 RepID=UPI0021E91406|nr:chaperone protein dnaJ 1, mitochondrial isoform X2 [Andrographis paniculata]